MNDGHMISRTIPYIQTTPALSAGVVEFRYNPDDPLAVTLMFGELNSWVFGRDLLEQGLHGPVGLGSVHLWPDGAQLRMILSSPTGEARLSFNVVQVRHFVLAARQSVPRGHEAVDVDGLVERLLGGAA